MELTEKEFVQHVTRHLERARGVDLSGYSESFVLRSIRKRYGRSGAKSYVDYIRLIRSSEEETNQMLSALSINVTEFFRDKGAFESLSKLVLRPLVEEKARTGALLRVWSAGCATGQETYTISICMAEEIKRIECDRTPLIAIVGTDISVAALAKAKSGMYTREEVKGLPERYLSQYFVRGPEGYEVSSAARRCVRFARENLLDKPSSRFFDAIVCRNVLIYFSKPMHDIVTMNLYEALRPRGYLMLGRTETLMGTARHYFEFVDQENRILRKLS